MRAEASLLAVLLAAAVVTPLGPVQVSYVYSDSMSPTLHTNDGFALVPAGDVEKGDIITFRSKQGDTYVTHRVVGKTPEGFITKGDANPSADQAAGAPPVARSQIIGEVLTVAGYPVVIPGIGLLASFVEQYRLALLGALALLFGWRLKASGRGYDRSRARAFPATAGEVLRTIVVVALVLLVALPIVGGATQTVTYRAVNDPGQNSRAISTSETVERTLTLDLQDGADQVAIQTEEMTIRDRTRKGDKLTLTVAIPPAASAGEVTKRVRVYSYPAVAPAPLLNRLESIHPFLAIGASVVSGLAPLYLLGALVLDGRRRLRFREEQLQELVM